MTDDRRPPSGLRPPPEPETAAGTEPKPTAGTEPKATAGTEPKATAGTEPKATVEVAREAFAVPILASDAPPGDIPPVPTSGAQTGDIPPVPTSDAPSGDMRPLDLALQPPGAPTPLDVAKAGEYVATPVPPAPGAPDLAPPVPDASAVVSNLAPSVPDASAVAPPISAANGLPEAGGRRPDPGDDAILPAAYDEAALRDAVGAPVPRAKRSKSEPLDDDGLPRSSSRKTIVIAAVALVLGLGVAALVFLGRANGQRYVIACSTDHVAAEQGRTFPPWGTKPLVGAEWKALALPPNAECKPRETEDRAELERWYLDLLVDRASTTLTSKNLLDPVPTGKANPLDIAAEQLDQALLLSRAPERRDERKEVERLLGDVQYWRASLRLRDATTSLADAARQFDAAAAQRPRHATDANAWATFLHRLVDDLHAGPTGAPAAAPNPLGPAAAPSERPTAPMGTALPVEPEGSASEPAEPADAGLPTGGVLL